MKIVFFGSSEFSVPFLNSIYNSNHQVALVVTGIDKAKGRGRNMLGNPVKEYACKKDFKIIQADKIDNEIFTWIERSKIQNVCLGRGNQFIPY